MWFCGWPLGLSGAAPLTARNPAGITLSAPFGGSFLLRPHVNVFTIQMQIQQLLRGNMSSKLEELLQKKAKIERDIARAKAEARSAARRADDRRKILAGAFVLSHQAENLPNLANWSINGKRFQDFLTRDDERALFGFPPRSQSNGAPAKSGAQEQPAQGNA